MDWSDFQSLDPLGINGIALKKDHDRHMNIVNVWQEDEELRVIASLDGRDTARVNSFFKFIPHVPRETLKTVGIDIYNGDVYATTELFETHTIVDRCLVAKPYRRPFNPLKINEMVHLKAELEQDEYAKLDGMMRILRNKRECLSVKDKFAL